MYGLGTGSGHRGRTWAETRCPVETRARKVPNCHVRGVPWSRERKLYFYKNVVRAYGRKNTNVSLQKLMQPVLGAAGKGTEVGQRLAMELGDNVGSSS